MTAQQPFERRALGAIAVFCGSNQGGGPEYAEAAAALGRALAERGITLVYGGTHKGLMGILADPVLEAGGRPTALSPRACTDAAICTKG